MYLFRSISGHQYNSFSRVIPRLAPDLADQAMCSRFSRRNTLCFSALGTGSGGSGNVSPRLAPVLCFSVNSDWLFRLSECVNCEWPVARCDDFIHDQEPMINYND